MTNETILKQAMEKAVKNGYCKGFLVPEFGISCEACSPESEEMCIYTNIFSHDFAKAFWGEENRRVELKDELGTTMIMLLKTHEYHLMQMVREKDPLQYLKKYL